jgi:subtilisin family serine protease
MRATTAAFRLLIAALVAMSAFPTFAADGDTGAGRSPAGWVGVIVQLEDAPVATYKGGVGRLAATARTATAAKLDPTTRAVADYRAHLAGRHRAFEHAAQQAVPGARAVYRYDMVLGGVAMQVPESAIATLEALPGVRAVYRDEAAALFTDKTPKLIGASAVWGKAGGVADAGEGVIVGVLDTGIWPEHPSFADPDPKGKPYVVPPGIRGCAFSGGANPGAPFACNGKLIGAYRFLAAYDACPTCAHPFEDFTSARDTDGHGSHTAATAAGNRAVVATIAGLKRGKVSGIAPRAHVIAYKVCGAQRDGCFFSDTIAAVQQAILDGVDVINFSVAGGTHPYLSPSELAFRDAYAAGIFVAAGAGNSGPTADTVSHRGGWVTTVGASTQARTFTSKIQLAADDGAKLKLVGTSITPGIAKPVPVVDGLAIGDEDCVDPTPDGAFTGAIAVCRRSLNAQGTAVLDRGGVGAIYYHDPPVRSGRTDAFFYPSVDVLDGSALFAFLAQHTGITAKFTAGKATKTRPDVVTSFSSRGGTGMTFGIGKPDVLAPGDKILAADTPERNDPAAVDGELFQVIQGTSMATPHVAGAAALLRDLHPDWTPGQIHSALRTTALNATLVRDDGVTPADPFDRGSGRIQLKKAMAPGITFDVPAVDYATHADDLWTVNHPSVFLPVVAPNAVTVTRTAKSELQKESVWSLVVQTPPDLAVTVPAAITVPAAGTADFTIGVDKSALPAGAVRHAQLTLKHKAVVATIPITAVGSRPLPDLVLDLVFFTSPVTAGGTIPAGAVIKNVGVADAGPLRVSLHLSLDQTLSPDDVFIGLCDVSASTAPGATAPCGATYALFSNVPPGTYYGIAAVDAEGKVAESDETNNVAAQAATVTVN